jgi:hypothetical protein
MKIISKLYQNLENETFLKQYLVVYDIMRDIIKKQVIKKYISLLIEIKSLAIIMSNHFTKVIIETIVNKYSIVEQLK